MIRVSVSEPPFSISWNAFVMDMYNRDNDNFSKYFDVELAASNAVNVYGTEFIEFEHKEDIVAFMLKFG
jgi:hypothetical protein